MDPREAAMLAIFGAGNTGADPTDITQFQQKVAANDIWHQAAAPVYAAKFDNSTWTPGQSVGASALQAFLGTALNQYGNHVEAQQLEDTAKVLPALYANPGAVNAPEGVDPEAFAGLKLNALSRQTKGAAAQNADLFKELFGVKLAGMTAAEQAKGKIAGENQAFGEQGQKNPDSPEVKEADAARTEIAKLPAVQQFNLANTTLARIKDFKDENTATSDIPFITLFVGGLDGSVVKDGEYQRVQGTNPILQQYKNLFEASLNGGSSLGVDVKNRIYNEFMGSQQSLLDEATRASAQRLSTAISRGVKNPLDALPFDPTQKFPVVTPTPINGGGGVTLTPAQVAAANAEAAALAKSGLTPAAIAAQLRSKYGNQVAAQ